MFFFAQLGGNSLQAGAVTSRVRGAMDLDQDVPAAWVFSYQTIKLLADKIARHALAPDAPRLAPLRSEISRQLASPAGSLNAQIPLSFQQV